jgi:hypothetical protein
MTQVKISLRVDKAYTDQPYAFTIFIRSQEAPVSEFLRLIPKGISSKFRTMSETAWAQRINRDPIAFSKSYRQLISAFESRGYEISWESSEGSQYAYSSRSEFESQLESLVS